jgi:hypothetical protein
MSETPKRNGQTGEWRISVCNIMSAPDAITMGLKLYAPRMENLYTRAVEELLPQTTAALRGHLAHKPVFRSLVELRRLQIRNPHSASLLDSTVRDAREACERELGNEFLSAINGLYDDLQRRRACLLAQIARRCADELTELLVIETSVRVLADKRRVPPSQSELLAEQLRAALDAQDEPAAEAAAQPAGTPATAAVPVG